MPDTRRKDAICLTPGGLDIVIIGLSITSSWGNGHATVYRGLAKSLSAARHRVLFLERDKPWYAQNRDMPHPPYCSLGIYDSLDDLKSRFARSVERADAVIVGSYVPEGVEAGQWVLEAAGGVAAFYDIDTPVTLATLARGDCEYITKEQIASYDIYFSFTGGPILRQLERDYGSPLAVALYSRSLLSGNARLSGNAGAKVGSRLHGHLQH